MRIKERPDGNVYCPDDDERKTLEELVEKGVVEYVHGGYRLTRKGVKTAKKLFEGEGNGREGDS